MVERTPFSFGSGEPSASGEHELGDGGSVGGGDEFGAVALPGSGGNDGDTDALGNRFDESIHAGRDKFNGDGSYRKRRGRKAGSAGRSASAGSSRKKEASYSASLDALSSTLMVVHAGLSSLTKTPELALDKEDSENLAKAVANVLVEFDVTPDPKIQAVVGLVMTAGMVYGPKLYMINERKKQSKKKPASIVTLDGSEFVVPPAGE